MPSDQNATTPIHINLESSPSTLQVAKKCLDSVKKYQRSAQKPADKATAIGCLVECLSASTPGLAEDEFNNSLSMYLAIIKQHNRRATVGTAMESGTTEQSEAPDESPVGLK
jgi:hypothetical protein